jgi:hypothetical protein
MLTKTLSLLVIIGVVLAVGFTKADAAILGNLQGVNAERVKMETTVVQNSYPVGSEDYRTWTLVLAAPGGGQIVAQEQGYNPETLVSAYYLAEAARKAGQDVIVTGEMKTLPNGETILAVHSIQYGECKIKTNEGPFLQYHGDDVYPGSPIFYGGQTFYPGQMPY